MVASQTSTEVISVNMLFDMKKEVHLIWVQTDCYAKHVSVKTQVNKPMLWMRQADTQLPSSVCQVGLPLGTTAGADELPEPVP